MNSLRQEPDSGTGSRVPTRTEANDRTGPVSLSIAEEVAQAHRALATMGQTDMVWGHVSARDADGRGVWMKAAGWGFEEITSEHVVLVSPAGLVLEGDGKRHIEYPIHTKIMEARPDVGAVVHGHARATAVFASLDVPLRPISHDAVPFLDPDIPRYVDSGDLIRTGEMGSRLAETIGGSAGALIPGHGFVVVGPNLAVAVMRAVLLERACSNHLSALAAGGPVRWSDEAEVESKRQSVWSLDQYQAGYDYLLRQAT